jgi:replicative DNA helicase
MSKQPDEADSLKAGTASPDPTKGTRIVAAEVPRVRSLRDIMTASRERAFTAGQGDDKRLTTGHYRLDYITGKIRPGFVWLIGGDTSVGKTSLLVSIADENLLQGKKVLIVSAEDPEELYGDRFMVRRTGIDAIAYRDGKLTPDDRQKVLEAETNAGPMPVYVEAIGWKIERLEPHLRSIIKDCSIDLIAYDYIQEFESKNRHQDERTKYKEIAKVCRRVAKESKIAGVILSQLTFSQDGKTKVPNRHNIRECRDIANAAEVILIAFEPDKAIEDDRGDVIVPAGTKCIHVDKVKNGPRGAKVPLDWDQRSASFRTVHDPLLPPPEVLADLHNIADEDPRYP